MTDVNFSLVSDVWHLHQLEFNKFKASLPNYYSYHKNFLLKNEAVLTNKSFRLQCDVIISIFPQCNYFYNSTDPSLTIVLNNEYRLSLVKESGYVYSTIVAKDKATADEIMDMVSSYFDDYNAAGIIHSKWSFLNTDAKLEDISFQVKNSNKFIPELYPSIPDVENYFERFKNSDENTLIIIGEPGLGKTAFIREMLKFNGWDSTFTYDENVMSRDQFYINFMKGSSSVLVLEDADLLLQNRLEDGNKLMSKLLNSSDGLIQFNKKFIFTANINNTRDIDPALMRPGRCFDVLHFHPLTMEQAKRAADKIGVSLPTPQQTFTVAELFNQKNDGRSNVVPLMKTGFR